MPAVIENDMSDPPVFTQEAAAVNYYEGPSFANDYEIVEGVMVLPVAESPPESPSDLKSWSPVVKIRLHSPYRIRTSKFSAVKQNGPPVLPGPGDQGAFIFTGGSLAFSNVYVQDGVYNWNSVVVYQYVENCVSRTIDGFVLGTPAVPYPTTMMDFSLSTFSGSPGFAGGSGSPTINSPGAIAYAGEQAKTGWLNQAVGPDLYNFPSFFPGVFFNDGLMNGSLTAVSGSGSPPPPMQPVPQ